MAPSDLRTTILGSAVAYITEHGPDGLSLRQLAQAAGVSHQAPYHHFTDRSGIFKAIHDEGFAMLLDAMRQALTDSATDDPATALLEAYVFFALDHRGHFRVMFRPDLCPQDDAGAPSSGDRAFDTLVDFVRTALGPDASIADIRARAAAMWSLAHGLATLLIDGPLERKLGPVAERRRFIRAVARQSGFTTTGAQGSTVADGSQPGEGDRQRDTEGHVEERVGREAQHEGHPGVEDEPGRQRPREERPGPGFAIAEGSPHDLEHQERPPGEHGTENHEGQTEVVAGLGAAYRPRRSEAEGVEQRLGGRTCEHEEQRVGEDDHQDDLQPHDPEGARSRGPIGGTHRPTGVAAGPAQTSTVAAAARARNPTP
ncbi:MAG: TetR/AcrR family transcriptional regulator [Actinomycetota bacterium]